MKNTKNDKEYKIPNRTYKAVDKDTYLQYLGDRLGFYAKERDDVLKRANKKAEKINKYIEKIDQEIRGLTREDETKEGK